MGTPKYPQGLPDAKIGVYSLRFVDFSCAEGRVSKNSKVLDEALSLFSFKLRLEPYRRGAPLDEQQRAVRVIGLLAERAGIVP